MLFNMAHGLCVRGISHVHKRLFTTSSSSVEGYKGFGSFHSGDVNDLIDEQTFLDPFEATEPVNAAFGSEFRDEQFMLDPR
jgi:hypothetical protein